MESYANIRECHFVRGWSIRKIARKFGFSRNTVRKYIAEGVLPQYHRNMSRASPVLGPFVEIIDNLITEDLKKPRKERFIAHTLFKYLKEIHGYSGAESTLRKYFSRRRRELSGVTKVTVPLVHSPNGEAQADWIEDVPVLINGERTLVQVFCLRTTYSGKKFVIAYPRMGMEFWLDAHRKGFDFLGGVPTRITYDNLKTAVIKVFKGRKRKESDDFLSFRGYYGFESFYCMPATPREKGAVENSVGYVRRNFFVPSISGGSLEEINRQLLEKCREEDSRVPSERKESIGEAFEREKNALLPIPPSGYDCCKVKFVKIAGSTSSFRFEKNRYSVPAGYVHQTLTLKVYPDRLAVYRDEKEVAVHQRLFGVYEESLDPFHFLSCLQKRPGLLFHGKPFVGWKLPREFSRYFEILQSSHGENAGKDYVKVLLLMQEHSKEEVRLALGQAIRCGAHHPDAVESLLKVKKLVSSESLKLPEIIVCQPKCSLFDRLLVEVRR